MAETPPESLGFVVPVDNPKALVAWAEKRWLEHASARPLLTPKMALYFYWGFHNLVHNPKTNELRVARPNRRKKNAPVRVTSNIIGDVVDRSIGKLTKSLPTPEGRPTTTNPEDIDASKVATNALLSEWNRLKMNSVIPALYQWVVPVGWSFLQVTWNPKGGKKIGELEYGAGEQTDPARPKQSLFTGDIQADIVPYDELIFDGPNLRASRYAIRQIAMTPEQIYETFGKVIPADAVGKGAFRTVTGLSDDLLQATDFGIEGRRTSSGKVAVRQLWIRPNTMRDAPKGLVMTYVGNMLIEKKDWPYDHGQLPFIQLNWLPPQGSPFGRTPIHGTLALQMDANDALSRRANIRRQVVPKFTYVEGSVDADGLSTRAEQVPYKEGFSAAPRWDLPDARWTKQYDDAFALAKQEIWERMGLTEAARGELAGTSPGVTAITQAELQDDVRVMPGQELQRFIEEMGWQMLMLIKQFWSEKRLIATTTKYGNLQTRRYKGADITDQISVQVKSESGLPKSKSGRAQLMIELHQAGLLGAMGDTDVLTELLDLPPTSTLSLELNRQKAKQEREIFSMLETGKVAQINPLSDDHSIHAKVIMDYMQEQDFELLKEREQKVLIDHLLGHMMFIQQQLQQMQQQQAQEQDAGGGASLQEAAMGGLPGQHGEIAQPTPGITELAAMGQHAGQPGPIPGLPDDTVAAALGR